MDNDKIIERGTQSLSFVEQLQNQIQLCREGLSDNNLPLTPKVEALEILLWAKLKNDKEYTERVQELQKWFAEKIKDLLPDRTMKNDDARRWINFKRNQSKKQFKAIMIFIDKKGYMPLGDENE
jgi:hypothetical protein